ncbi:ornithine cyclodeaminase family protein, partial [Paremcibacter congregatus]|uniref:ornithine cyclodeaminase family protein n=1 Tax=Paremcibacter congregatus TaxID=2043170 RepID=UPI003A8E5CF1
ATVFPGANDCGLPAVQGTYLLCDGKTGQLKAMLDGTMLTARRTAAASALAASYLARDDASVMVMAGTGALAPHLVEAHCSIRPIRKLYVWGLDLGDTKRIVSGWSIPDGVEVECIGELESVVREADLISCATLAEDPLVRGDWLKPGAHLDLVGAFKPTMRESDDQTVMRSDVYVDTREGTLKEAGDLLQPMSKALFAPDDIIADLFELCSGMVSGRTDEKVITLYKSVGASLMDLAAAEMVVASLAIAGLDHKQNNQYLGE